MSLSTGITTTEISELLDALGIDELPMALYFTDTQPDIGFHPQDNPSLPTAEQERRGEVDWQKTYDKWSCVMAHITTARKKRSVAWFSPENFGCLGGATYLGYLRSGLQRICQYVSTGIPGQSDGERYLDSPEAMRRFIDAAEPPEPPARYCVVKPIENFLDKKEIPLVVIFHARPESISGLHVLSSFVTGDPEIVAAPFGAGCGHIIGWPLRYIANGKPRAVLGGWDPSARKFMRTDEMSFAVPFEMFEQMVSRWRESFLTTHEWERMKKRIARSKAAWI
jgi:uncharacterized protein (DUF169 family)